MISQKAFRILMESLFTSGNPRKREGGALSILPRVLSVRLLIVRPKGLCHDNPTEDYQNKRKMKGNQDESNCLKFIDRNRRLCNRRNIDGMREHTDSRK